MESSDMKPQGPVEPLAHYAAACAESSDWGWGPIRALVRMEEGGERYDYTLDIDGTQMGGGGNVPAGHTARALAEDIVMNYVDQAIEQSEGLLWTVAVVELSASDFEGLGAERLSVNFLSGFHGHTTETYGEDGGDEAAECEGDEEDEDDEGGEVNE